MKVESYFLKDAKDDYIFFLTPTITFEKYKKGKAIMIAWLLFSIEFTW